MSYDVEVNGVAGLKRKHADHLCHERPKRDIRKPVRFRD